MITRKELEELGFEVQRAEILQRSESAALGFEVKKARRFEVTHPDFDDLWVDLFGERNECEWEVIAVSVVYKLTLFATGNAETLREFIQIAKGKPLSLETLEIKEFIDRLKKQPKRD